MATKAKRTTPRSSTSKKLSAVRNKKGKSKGVQTSKSKSKKARK